MHARHRNPANGYRSNPIGIGGGGGGVVAGGAGYRSYNRTGFGRGQPKIFQSGPPPAPPRRIDVFMEAGKLATEYLVSKGLLPPNSLNGKWPNSNLKNQIGAGDGVSDAVSGTGAGRKRFPDDYSSTATGSRDGMKARRTMGSFKNPGIEWNREISREKVKDSSDKHGDDDDALEQRTGKDDDDDDDNLETAIEKKQNQLPDDKAELNAPVSDVSNKCGVESAEKSDCSKNLNRNEVMTDDNNGESEKPTVTEDTKNGSDLLALIRFNKIPTRTRSSLTLKGSRNDSVSISGDEKMNDSQNSGEPAGSSQHISIPDAQPDEKQGLNIQEAPSIDEVAEFDHNYKLCTRSQSFPQRSSVSKQELGEEQPAYSRCSSDVLGRLEKRPLHLIDNANGAKKPCNAYAEEKQLFPGSFKICDLNLVEVSDVNDNHHDANSVISFSSIGQPKQEPVSVDFDLSMRSRHTRRGSDGKEVEVIDLDCDSGQDDKVFSSSDTKDETIFTDLESFPDSMQRVSEMPQDGYGLIMSELLEADIPTSSVPTGVNSMDNEEGILGDDESIYMSLGEIPISMPKL